MRWEIHVILEDLVEDDLVVLALEHFLSACHFVNDDAQGPQVCEKAGLVGLEHFGSAVERCSNECASIFLSLPLGTFLLLSKHLAKVGA